MSAVWTFNKPICKRITAESPKYCIHYPLSSCPTLPKHESMEMLVFLSFSFWASNSGRLNNFSLFLKWYIASREIINIKTSLDPFPFTGWAWPTRSPADSEVWYTAINKNLYSLTECVLVKFKKSWPSLVICDLCIFLKRCFPIKYHSNQKRTSVVLPSGFSFSDGHRFLSSWIMLHDLGCWSWLITY